MGIISYAQNFEDVMLWRALKGVSQGFYVDVGAQHPRVDSVSQAFFDEGWTGVHVEPAGEYTALLRVERPGDKVIEAAVSKRRGQANFHRISGTGLSSLEAGVVELGRARGFDVMDEVVNTITLDDVFAEIDNDIHWLKIDVEGHEKSVLQGWKCAVRPWIILIESTAPASSRETHQTWEPLVLEKGYIFVWFDGLNRFYVSEDHQDLANSFSSPPNVFDTFQLSGEATSTFATLLNDRTTRAIEEGDTHRQWAAAHLVNVEAAAEARLSAVQVDHLKQVKAHVQELTDLADQLEREKHALMADYSQSLRDVTSENRQLIDKLVQATTEQAAMVVRHQQDQIRQEQIARTAFDESQRALLQISRDAATERNRVNETLTSVVGEIKHAHLDVQTARLAEQSAALDAAVKTARLDEVTTQARVTEEALTRQLNAVRAEHAAERQAEAECRNQLVSERLAVEAQLAEVQTFLQAALRADQASTVQPQSDPKIFELERETAASTMQALNRAADERRRVLRAWRQRVDHLRKSLLGEQDIDSLVQGLVGADPTSQGVGLRDPALTALDDELRHLSTVIVAMAHVSENQKNSFSVRLRTLIGGSDGLTKKYSVATTAQPTARRAHKRGSISFQEASGFRTKALARKSGIFRWFGGRTQESIEALQERMDHLADLGAVLVAQGARGESIRLVDRMDGIDQTLAGIITRLDHLSDVGAVSVAQGTRLEQSVSGLANLKSASDQTQSEEQAESLSDALLLHGQNHPLSPAGMATLDALARAMRSSNT